MNALRLRLRGQSDGEGVSLEAVPARMALWADWKEEHPGTLVLVGDPGKG